MEQLSFQDMYLYPLGLGCPFGSNTLGLLWLAPISFENCVLHSSTGKSFGWVCLDHIPSKISSYLASLQAVHGGISCKYNWVVLKSTDANLFGKHFKFFHCESIEPQQPFIYLHNCRRMDKACILAHCICKCSFIHIPHILPFYHHRLEVKASRWAWRG